LYPNCIKTKLGKVDVLDSRWDCDWWWRFREMDNMAAV